MQTNNLEQSGSDRFIFIGCHGKKRKELSLRLKERQGFAVEVLAPVERRMIRPRRKSSKREAFFIEVPLFYEYVAVNFEHLKEKWKWLVDLEIIWFVLIDGDQNPKLIERQNLMGFLSEVKNASWEGANVEFIRGPLKGKQGIFEGGRVSLGVWGKPKVNPFDLILAREK